MGVGVALEPNLFEGGGVASSTARISGTTSASGPATKGQ